MNISFKLDCSNKSEKDLCRSFCDFIVTSMAQEIVNYSNVLKIKVLSDKILSMKWISWIGRPVNYLDPKYLLNVISNSLEYKELKNGLYIIKFNSSACYPGSKTKLERFVKFLDKGNLSIKGSHIFTSIFTKYSEQIVDLWKKYKSNKLRIYDIDNSFMIR